MAIKKEKKAVAPLDVKRTFGVGQSVKFQVYDYEPIETHVYYQSDAAPNESDEALANRVASIVKAELDKRIKEQMADLKRLREEAFAELAEADE